MIPLTSKGTKSVQSGNRASAWEVPARLRVLLTAQLGLHARQRHGTGQIPDTGLGADASEPEGVVLFVQFRFLAIRFCIVPEVAQILANMLAVWLASLDSMLSLEISKNHVEVWDLIKWSQSTVVSVGS